VEAINAYRQEHGMVGMAVCSRVADYAALTAKLKLRGAIMVQPLTDEQIDRYLAQAGDQLVAVQTLLHEDAEMRELAETPLMLSIMSLAYQGMPPEALPEHVSLDARRRHLFDTYVERMLKRRGGSKHYSPEQTRHWLSWLAGRMHENNLTVFEMERMPPTWLGSWWQYAIYTLIIGLGGMLFDGTLIGIFFGVLLGMLYGPMTGFIIGVVFGGFFGSIIGLYLCVTSLINKPDIAPVQGWHWSWQQQREKLLLLLLFSSVVGLVSGVGIDIVFGLAGGIASILNFALPVVLAFIAMNALHRGLQYAEVVLTSRPNEGIHHSVQAALLVAPVSGIVFGLILFWLSFPLHTLFSSTSIHWLLYLILTISVSILLWLHIMGIFAVLQHYSLRLVLWRNHDAPLNYVRFLDHAAERILLRKVGGGYIFVHRMLLEYFASLEEEKQRKNDTSDDRPT
jgi:MFS family permease